MESAFNRSSDLCIHELFEAQAARNSNKTAVICRNQRLTYGELSNATNALAQRLSFTSVRADVLVGVCASRSAEMIIGPLSVLKAGGAYVPLDPDWPHERLSLVLEDACLSGALVEPSRMGNFPRRKMEIVPLGLDDLQNAACQKKLRGCAKDNLAYVLFTSGSTGTPNGVMVEHHSVTNLLRPATFHPFDPDEVFLSLSPLTFDASVFELWGPLVNGGTVVIHPASLITPEALGRTIRRNGITSALLTPALFHETVECCIDALSPLRHLLVGGDVISPQLFQRAIEHLKHTQVVAAYGPTENTCITTTCSLRAAQLATYPSVPLGTAISGTTVCILTEELTPTSQREIGELCIAGEGLARGYLHRPELTATRFISHPWAPGQRLYRTGDLARYFPDGNIEFCGRLDHQVKVRGFRIDLLEIETALKAHPGVQDAVAVAGPKTSGTKSLSAFVVWRRPADCCRKKLIEYLRERLPAYMVPLDLQVLDALPRNSNGKVDRLALMELAGAKTKALT